MGYFTKIFGKENDNIDEDTGLTTKEKKLVRNSWQYLLKKDNNVGVDIFVRLFDKFPQYQDVFNDFKQMSIDELSKSWRFSVHCKSIITTLSSAIDALDDFNFMKELIMSVGIRHGRRSHNKQPFYDLRIVIEEVLQEKLDKKFTPEVSDAWTKTLNLFVDKIIEGIEKFSKAS